ncbi:hypothetical protein [Moorena sp. SIO4E2]|uniref:hypothetical protein n=1 Tax=Moorena sp. SIO4E2 TaxID=2607826 RepID=UPI00257AFA61|nr:hypothetical protein [Moorena sp. SIO4E2]
MNTSTQARGEAFLKSIESLPWVHYHGHIARSRSVAERPSHSRLFGIDRQQR